jgi:hypothetical protein
VILRLTASRTWFLGERFLLRKLSHLLPPGHGPSKAFAPELLIRGFTRIPLAPDIDALADRAAGVTRGLDLRPVRVLTLRLDQLPLNNPAHEYSSHAEGRSKRRSSKREQPRTSPGVPSTRVNPWNGIRKGLEIRGGFYGWEDAAANSGRLA